MFGDESYLDMFGEAYSAAMGHMQLAGSFQRYGWLVDVHMDTGTLARPWISSLSAFWPGLQALAGRVLGSRRPRFVFGMRASASKPLCGA